MPRTETIDSFAKFINNVLRTDRWALIACDGEMGEGKSCFTSQLAMEISKHTKQKFTFEDNMTYLRTELKTWIDGEDEKGKNRKKQFSTILADELISMFFKRNWYDSAQIDGIELLNKCRDRHHCVIGNIPNFWDLDSAIYPLVTFWIHIHERGRAWVFQKDQNPFASDKWHKRENEKKYAKKNNPYGCKGFVCEIYFPDWSPKDKEAYYGIRNKKRVNTEGQRKKDVRYKDIKKQRDTLIRMVFQYDKKLTNDDLASLVPDISGEAIRQIRRGIS